MNYEAISCVMKNEDGTPMYGLLIKPVQNQIVFQLAPNQQPQESPQPQQVNQPIIVSSPFSQSPSSGAFLTLPPQASASSWNGNQRSASSGSSATPSRRHYPTILPRETTPSASKTQPTTNWASGSTGGYSNFNGNNNGFAAIVQSNSKTPPCLNAVKFAYATAAPSAATIATPLAYPFVNSNNELPSTSFTQANTSHGFLSSQPVTETNGVDPQLVVDQQQFSAVFDQGNNGVIIHSVENGGILLSNDCAAGSSNINVNGFGGNNNGGGGCSSTDLDSLLRDIDLSEITNSLIPLLQDCSGENGEDAFSDRMLVPAAVATSEQPKMNCSNDLVNNASTGVVFEGNGDVAQVPSCHGMTATTSRPPCRYQGLLSNTNNLRVGCSTGMNTTSAIFSIFDPALANSADAPTPACVPENVVKTEGHSQKQPVLQAQAVPGDYDHPIQATTPDSGIQSIGDSPHAVPQSSPMQFFSSSPDARRRRISSPRSQASTSNGGNAGISTVVSHVDAPQPLLQQKPPQLNLQQSALSNIDQQINEAATSSASWTQNYMQPLSVNTAYFEPISECESSPPVRLSGNQVQGPQFAVLNAPPRCYSPSTTSSDCGNESSRRRSGKGSSSTKRKRRTKKKMVAGASTSATSMAPVTFDDMPILLREGDDASNQRVSPMDIGTPGPIRQSHPHQSKPSDKEQLTLNVSDPNALVEKLLSVVPKEQLASIRRILDERLSDSRNGTGSNRGNGASSSLTIENINFLKSRATGNNSTSSLEKSGLSRWQSKNAGYASDTSDVSSLTDSALRSGRKKTTEEEGDSAASSGVTWRELSSPSSKNLRRSSASSASAVQNDPKKQDPLKKLLEYRAKARSNCVKATVGSRVNELIPTVTLLRIKDGQQESVSSPNSLAAAFKKVHDKLAVLKDAPTLVKEKDSNEVDKQNVVFNNLQNLEIEASDDDEEDVSNDALSPCPELTAERVDETSKDSQEDGPSSQIVNEEPSVSNTIEETPATSKKLLSVEQEESSSELVQVNENPQRKNISVKIKLSLLRRTSSESVSSKKEKKKSGFKSGEKRHRLSTATDKTETAATTNSGKGKRINADPVLPPKKRFKDGETSSAAAAVVVDGHQVKQEMDNVESSQKRHQNVRLQSSATNGGKKRKTATDPASTEKRRKIVEEIDLTGPSEPPTTIETTKGLDVAKSSGSKDAVRLGVFRKCGACKTWIRVEESDGVDLRNALCADCRNKETAKTRPTSKPAKEKSVKRMKEKGGEKNSVVAAPPAVQSVNRTVVAASNHVWKYPRKSYVKAGIFRNVDGSDTPQPLPVIFSPTQCRLLGAGADTEDFQLPYDIWWHHKHQKDFMCVDPSENYRKLRANIYVDGKPSASFQHNVCSCKPSSNLASGGCGDGCLNRMMFTECCASTCPCGDQCTNNRFQRREWADGLNTFDSGTAKGKGIRTKKIIKEGAFICEYMGEIVSTKTFGERMATWYKNCNHHYALNLDAGTVIDGYRCGSIARFINHSCDPNCEMQKWWVNGQYRMGVFALRDIEPDEELTYNYKFHAFDKPQACLCASASCRGFVDGSAASHQTRKSKPKRSNTDEILPDSPASKLNLLKPLSHRERVLVIKRRLFLLRNVDGIRKKLQALNGGGSSETGTSVDDEKRKADILSSQLTALKTSRCIRTRRLAVSDDDAQIQKLAGLIQLLKTVLQTLMSAEDKDGKLLVGQVKKNGGAKSSKKHQTSTVQNEISSDFGAIERKVERGFYTTPDAFDRDIKALFGQLKSNGDCRQSIEELERLYESAKAGIADQLKDALGFQLSADFLSTQPVNDDVGENGAAASSSNDFDQQVSTAGAEDSTDDLYWGTSSPFQGTVEIDENEASALWSERGDSFDQQDDKVHCVCGICEDDGMMIQCDRCRYWLHSECVGVAGEQIADDYVCEFCSTGKLALFKDVVLSPQPEIRLQHCIYYRSLIKDGFQVRIGECVYVKKNIDEKHKQLLRNFNRECVQASSSGDDPLLLDDGEIEGEEVGAVSESSSSQRSTFKRSDLRVFRVERLFIGPRGVKFVFGSYFARPHETFCEPSRRFYRNEIFVTPLYDTLPLDAVVGRCLVVDVQTYCKGRPKYPKYTEEDIYICEYRLDKGQRLFDKMHVRNRYPICTKPYIFEKFTEKMKVRRDFTPFNKVRRPSGGQQSKGATSMSKKDDHSKKRVEPSKTTSNADNRISTVKTKRRRVEQIIEKLKKEVVVRK